MQCLRLFFILTFGAGLLKFFQDTASPLQSHNRFLKKRTMQANIREEAGLCKKKNRNFNEQVFTSGPRSLYPKAPALFGGFRPQNNSVLNGCV